MSISSPLRKEIKSKKKYSGALFLENDDLDCFTDHLDVSDDVNDEIIGKVAEKPPPIKTVSRRESSHLHQVGSASRKFSKKIEEERNEEAESEAKPTSLPQTAPTPQSSQYSATGSNYMDMYPPGFFPSSPHGIGMNSIPMMPQPSQLHRGVNPYLYNQTYMISKDYSHQPQEQTYHIEDQMADFSEYHASESDGKLMLLKLEKDPAYFERVFASIIHSFGATSSDSTNTMLMMKIVEIAALQPAKLQLIVQNIKGRILTLCMDPSATRVMQKIIEKVANKPELLHVILGELKGNICKMVMCNNGNHVVQKLVNQVSNLTIEFVYQEILDRFKMLANHKHGCCVIQRCIDHCTPEIKVPAAHEGKVHRGDRATRDVHRGGHVRQLRTAVHLPQGRLHGGQGGHMREVATAEQTRAADPGADLPEVQLERLRVLHQEPHGRLHHRALQVLLEPRESHHRLVTRHRQLRRADAAQQLRQRPAQRACLAGTFS
jgi:Pumilio-family RNA binding repeat